MCYLGDGLKLHIAWVRHCGIGFLSMSGLPIPRWVVQPTWLDDLASKTGIDELTSYDTSITECFAKNNKQYPILAMSETQGLPTDIFHMEYAKHSVNQYETELSMLDAESYDKESWDKLVTEWRQRQLFLSNDWGNVEEGKTHTSDSTQGAQKYLCKLCGDKGHFVSNCSKPVVHHVFKEYEIGASNYQYGLHKTLCCLCCWKPLDTYSEGMNINLLAMIY